MGTPKLYKSIISFQMEMKKSFMLVGQIMT